MRMFIKVPFTRQVLQVRNQTAIASKLFPPIFFKTQANLKWWKRIEQQHRTVFVVNVNAALTADMIEKFLTQQKCFDWANKMVTNYPFT
jgi:Txe/YoeB family toxin of Txe-Axe toxin-antitoxin module